MKSQLLIPKKIKVGYVNRQDTYTKKLAYVIYYDTKGTLRKEKSWEGWRDKKITPDDFENLPTEGFVLNKKAGGYSSGWNHRATYCRVFDPRGFEFEISIPNLLFILQETNAFKGKGLEGEFVYAWEGKDLVLLPVSCEDYQKSNSFTKLQEGKVSTKELIPGATYKTKKQQNVIYMGKFPWYQSGYSKDVYVTNSYVFYNPSAREKFEKHSSLSHLSNMTSEIPVNNFSDLMEELTKDSRICPIKRLLENKATIDFGRCDYTSYSPWSYFRSEYYLQKNSKKLHPELSGLYAKKIEENKYRIFTITKHLKVLPDNFNSFGKYVEEIGFTIDSNKIVSFVDGHIQIKQSPLKDTTYYKKKEILDMDFFHLGVELNNGQHKTLNF
jgi:hypothetical protein